MGSEVFEDSYFETVISITRKDSFRFLRYHGSRKRRISLFVFSFLILIIVYYNSDLKTALAFIPFIAIYMILLSTFMFFILMFKSYRQHKSVHEYKDPMTLTFYSDHYTVQSNAGVGKVDWNNLYKVNSDSQNFYFYLSKSTASIVPKRYFTAEQLTQLSAMTDHLRK